MFSACLIAGVRLATAVIYYTKEDKLYNISAVLLWGMAELAIAFVIFCLPAIPAVFKGDKGGRWPSTHSHLWTRSTYSHPQALSGSEQPADNLTWKSSTFIESISVETQGGKKNPERIRQPYPPPKFRQYNSRQELGILNTIQNIDMSHATSFGDVQSSVEHNKPWVQDPHRNPNVSWYDEV
jgi:hypothetical protein